MSQRRRQPAEAPLCHTCGKKILEQREESPLESSSSLEAENYWQIDKQRREKEQRRVVEVTGGTTMGTRLVPCSNWPYHKLNLVAVQPSQTSMEPKSSVSSYEAMDISDTDSEDSVAESSSNSEFDSAELLRLPPKRRDPVVKRKQSRKAPKKSLKCKSGKRKKPHPGSKPKPAAARKKPKKVIKKATYEPHNLELHSPFSESQTELLIASESDVQPAYKSVVIREMQRLGRTPNAEYVGNGKPAYRLVCSRLLEKQKAEQTAQEQQEQQELEEEVQQEEAAVEQQKQEEALRQQEEAAFKGTNQEQQQEEKSPEEQAEQLPEELQEERQEDEPQQQQAEEQEEDSEQDEVATMIWAREGQSNTSIWSSDED